MESIISNLLSRFEKGSLSRRELVRGLAMLAASGTAASAQEVCNQLIECGITGILNFAPLVLHVPEEVMVNNVNLAIELENLSYFIQE